MAPEEENRRTLLLVLAMIFVGLCLDTGSCLFAGAVATGPELVKARVISETTRMEINGDGTATYSVQGRVRIFKESGRKYGEISLHESRFMKVERLTGRVYDAGGNLVDTRTKKDARRVCGFAEYALYADYCEYQLNLGAGNFPYTVEYDYSLKLGSLFFWPDWRPQGAIPVDTASCMVTAPTGFTYRLLAHGSINEPIRSTKNGKETSTWVLTDVPAILFEAHMPSAEKFLAGLEFAANNFRFDKYDIDQSSWSSASRSIYQLVKPSFRLSQQQIAVLDSIFPSHSVDAESCDRLHEFLSGRSRYVAITIGVGGWQPHAADETFAHGYGDCKDLSTMYITMLRQEGVTAKLALLMTRDRGYTDPDFATLRFNHAILFYLNDADTVWVDPTCFACRAGDLPWRDEGVFALIVDSTNGSVVKTPESRAMDNLIVRNALVSVNSDLSADLEVNVRASGDAGSYLRTEAQYTTAKEVAEELKRGPNIIGEAIRVTSYRIDSSNRELSSFGMTVTGRLQGYVRQFNGKTCMGLDALPLVSEPEQVDLLNRKFPVELQYPFAYVDTIRVSVPANMKISGIPQDWMSEDNTGEFDMISRMHGDTAFVVRFRSQTQSMIDSAAVPSFNSYRGRLYWSNNREVVIEKR